MSGGPNPCERLDNGALPVVDVTKRTNVDFGLDLTDTS
jgi:hypothetical protein